MASKGYWLVFFELMFSAFICSVKKVFSTGSEEVEISSYTCLKVSCTPSTPALMYPKQRGLQKGFGHQAITALSLQTPKSNA